MDCGRKKSILMPKTAQGKARKKVAQEKYFPIRSPKTCLSPIKAVATGVMLASKPKITKLTVKDVFPKNSESAKKKLSTPNRVDIEAKNVVIKSIICFPKISEKRPPVNDPIS